MEAFLKPEEGSEKGTKIWGVIYKKATCRSSAEIRATQFLY